MSDLTPRRDEPLIAALANWPSDVRANAVKEIARLRAIEAAARAFIVRWDDPETYHRVPAVAALREALGV